MSKLKEVSDYRFFTGPAELHKAVNTLQGLVAGITTDSKISDNEIQELANWCILHQELITKHPFNELIPMIEHAYSDGIITSEESEDIIWVCNNFISDSKYYDLTTSSMQFLFGMLHGVMADGQLSDEEIKHLRLWLSQNTFLEGTYPFDEIRALIASILSDNVITQDEREMLAAFMGEFVDTSFSHNINQDLLDELKNKYSISGICAMCDEINFDGTTFCFTGKSEKGSRNDVASVIEENGGIYSDRVTSKTDYLIVGNYGNPCWAYSCYGRKIEQAMNLRKDGSKIKIINEIDFWDIIEDL